MGLTLAWKLDGLSKENMTELEVKNLLILSIQKNIVIFTNQLVK